MEDPNKRKFENPEMRLTLEQSVEQIPLKPEMNADQIEQKVAENDVQIGKIEQGIANTTERIRNIKNELSIPQVEADPPSVISSRDAIATLKNENEVLRPNQFKAHMEDIARNKQLRREAIEKNIATPEQIRDERKSVIIQELEDEWISRNGPKDEPISRSEIAAEKEWARRSGEEWSGRTTKMTDRFSNFYFSFGREFSSVPGRAERILLERFPEYQNTEKIKDSAPVKNNTEAQSNIDSVPVQQVEKPKVSVQSEAPQEAPSKIGEKNETGTTSEVQQTIDKLKKSPEMQEVFRKVAHDQDAFEKKFFNGEKQVPIEKKLEKPNPSEQKPASPEHLEKIGAVIRDYLSYQDIDVPNEEKEKMLTWSEESPSARKYAEALNEIAEKYQQEIVDEKINTIKTAANSIWSKTGLTQSPYFKSKTWASWDLGKQYYFLTHQNEADPRYTLADAFKSPEKTAEIVDRQIGWEAYHSKDKTPLKKFEQHRLYKKLQEYLSKIPKSNGKLSSKEYAEIGAIIREIVG